MASTRVPTWLWVASVAALASWIALVSGYLAFAEKLPELDRIYIRSGAIWTLLIPLVATLIACVLPRRSMRRAIATLTGSLVFTSLVVARQYWEATQYYTGERLEAARRQRAIEIVMQNRTDRDFDSALRATGRSARSSPSATAK